MDMYIFLTKNIGLQKKITCQKCQQPEPHTLSSANSPTMHNKLVHRDQKKTNFVETRKIYQNLLVSQY